MPRGLNRVEVLADHLGPYIEVGSFRIRVLRDSWVFCGVRKVSEGGFGFRVLLFWEGFRFWAVSSLTA